MGKACDTSAARTQGRQSAVSTIAEPKELLCDDLRQFSEAGLSDRMQPVFDRGNPLLMAQIADHYGTGTDNLLCTTGCLSAVHLICRYLLGPGTHVVVESPVLDLLPALASGTGADISQVDREPGTFRLNPDRISAALRDDTRLIILANLHNPSGAVTGTEELLRLAAMAKDHDAYILVDEVYGDFVPATIRPHPAALLDPSIISVNNLT